MVKKAYILSIVFSVVLGVLCNISYATSTQTKLNVIKQSAETKYLENDQGYLSKTIVDSNPEDGEVTVELKLSNTKKETTKSAQTEIMLVIDNSDSMSEECLNSTRKELVMNSSLELIQKIFSNSSNVKIGIVTFSSKKYRNDPGICSIDEAKLQLELTDKKEAVIEKINEIKQSSTEYATNIEAGILRGKEGFSKENNNKIMIILSDGLPTMDTNGNYELNYSSSKFKTIIENTKKSLIDVSNSGINVISMLTGIDEGNNDSQEIINKLFGTKDNPTVGKFYNIQDTDIETVIKNNMFLDLMESMGYPISSAKIVDYFPQDITKNFDFSYDAKPVIGTVSGESIDSNTNTITWNVGELKYNEEAILRYKLKLKDMNNQELLNKVITTNDKVVLTYTDSNKKDYEVILSSSPQIKLEENQEQINGEDKNNEDDTIIKNKVIPQTGENIIFAISIILVLSFGMVMWYKSNKFRNIK